MEEEEKETLENNEHVEQQVEEQELEQEQMEQQKEELEPVEQMQEMLDESKKIEKRTRKYIPIMIIMIILLLLTSCAAGSSYLLYRNRSGKNLNIDINGDGWPELNVSISNGNVCQTNCDTGNGKELLYKSDGVPDYNITYGYLGLGYFNLDTDGDKKADTNLINRDINNDGICDINCDVDNDGWPDTNIDFSGSGIPTLNIDTDNDGVCDINCDINKDRIIDYNMDFNNDGTPDMMLDTDGDKVADKNPIDVYAEDGTCLYNCDTNRDGWPDKNIDLDGDGVIDIEDIHNVKEYQETAQNNISITSGKEYIVNYIDNDELDKVIVPSWTGNKTFKITNTTNSTLNYSIKWVDVYNNYTETNNLYFGLKRNGVKILETEQNRLPYKEGYILKDVEIKPNEQHNYDLNFLFKETGENQDVDKGKTFYAKIKITATE